MTYIGLVTIRNNSYTYSKPFILNKEGDDKFIAQIIRDVDYSLIIDKNETITIEIVKYPKSTSYIEYNISGNYHNFTILGTYNILFNKLNNDYIFEKKSHGSTSILIDDNYQLELYFTYISYKKIKYILSTPMLTGKIDYLKQITTMNLSECR